MAPVPPARPVGAPCTGRRSFFRWFGLGALLGGLALVSASPALAAPEGQEALTFLNQQRAANGISPISTLNQAYVTWCPNEDSGAWEGASGRDWSGGDNSSATTSPWDNAPLHQFIMYDPTWSAVGDVNVAEQACLAVGSPNPEALVPTFYAFIADSGPSSVPLSDTNSLAR